MGSTLKRARRAKDKSKKNRLEKTERKFLQSRRGFYSPSPEALLFFETLPCPFECKEKCIERLRYYMEHNHRPRPDCEDVVLVGAAVHMAMYKKWRQNRDGSIFIER